MRKFNYWINKDLSGRIEVDTNKCKKVGDLEQYIRADANIDKSHLIIFENPPKEMPLYNADKYDVINVSISYFDPIIFFRFPSKVIHIQASVKTTFIEIINIFKKNGFYYSDRCIEKNLRLSVEKKILPKNDTPLFGLKSGTFVDVDYFGNIAIIEYGNRKFIFSENELSRTAKRYINNIYQGCKSILIYDEKQRKEITDTEELLSNIKYKIRVNFLFKFRNLKDGNEMTLNMDFLSKVIDAQIEISNKYSNKKAGIAINPETIYIYNLDQIEHLDQGMTLKTV